MQCRTHVVRGHVQMTHASCFPQHVTPSDMKECEDGSLLPPQKWSTTQTLTIRAEVRAFVHALL
jgi:hypothetical protein